MVTERWLDENSKPVDIRLVSTQLLMYKDGQEIHRESERETGHYHVDPADSGYADALYPQPDQPDKAGQ
jgi:hypothetical protein